MKISILATGVATTPSESRAFILRNTSSATNGAQQYSPSLFIAGQGWGTTASTSQEVVFRVENQTIQGTTPTGSLVFSSSIAGGAYASALTLSSAGSLTTMSTLFVGSGGQWLTFTQSGSGGYGLAPSISSGQTGQSLVISGVRSSGSGNISVALVGAVAASSIHDAHIVCDFSWKDNSNVKTSSLQVKPKSVKLPVATVAGAPTSAVQGDMFFCSNGNAGSPCLALYDGSNWKVVALGATIS